MGTTLLLVLTLFTAAANVDVVVLTLPPKSDVSIPLGANGKAELKRDSTTTHIKIELDRVQPPASFGPAFSTYVVWSVSPEGDVENVGELALEKDRARLDVTTRFEQVGLLVTAEPHYMVDRPSSAVAFKSVAPKSGDVRRQNVSVSVGLDDYARIQAAPQAGQPALVMEARLAVAIAKAAEADRWAETDYRHAKAALDTMEEMLGRTTPFEILSQSANEAVRRSQQAVVASRQKKIDAALESARRDAANLAQEIKDLNSRIQQLNSQQNAANTQIQRLQGDVATANRSTQRANDERDQAAARERAVAAELAEVKKKFEDLGSRLVLQLRTEYFDAEASALNAVGKDALTRLASLATAVPGPVSIEGPAPNALFDAAKKFLIDAGIPADRIFLKR